MYKIRIRDNILEALNTNSLRMCVVNSKNKNRLKRAEVILHSKGEPSIHMSFETYSRLSKYIPSIQELTTEIHNASTSIYSSFFNNVTASAADTSIDKIIEQLKVGFMATMITGVENALNDTEFIISDDDIITIQKSLKNHSDYTLKDFLNTYKK